MLIRSIGASSDLHNATGIARALVERYGGSAEAGIGRWVHDDEAPVSEVAKKHGVSDVTIYAWRKRFGTLEAMDVRRLKAVEQENARLKKLLAERDLEIEVMKEITQGKY